MSSVFLWLLLWFKNKISPKALVWKCLAPIFWCCFGSFWKSGRWGLQGGSRSQGLWSSVPSFISISCLTDTEVPPQVCGHYNALLLKCAGAKDGEKDVISPPLICSLQYVAYSDAKATKAENVYFSQVSLFLGLSSSCIGSFWRSSKRAMEAVERPKEHLALALCCVVSEAHELQQKCFF